MPQCNCATNTLEPGWAPFSSPGLGQWGPKVTSDFLGLHGAAGGYGLAPGAIEGLVSVVTALRDDNEFDVQRLLGGLKGARS